VRVEIPRDVGAVQRASLDEAARWRASTRAAFTAAIARGYRVRGFVRPAPGSGEGGGEDARGSYLLELSEHGA
jgi:predicted GNAT superfamily acetyltransferase